ncbi:putative leucoanthocyanidin dioxygenase, partial [Delitschia confertaspora ATCC 74209]
MLCLYVTIHHISLQSMASKTVSRIPIIDLSPFTSFASLSSRKLAAKDLASTLHLNGSVGITGHGFPASMLQEIFDIAKKLFDLPYEDKMRAPHPSGPTPHRGYSGPGKEMTGRKTALETNDVSKTEEILRAADYKESYEIGSSENKTQYNILLPEDVFPGFREKTTRLFWELNKTAKAVLDALIMSLGLREEEAAHIRSLHTGHDDQLRLLHYPPIPVGALKGKDTSRLGAHTDWSLFTLLFQDVVGRLEFLDREIGDYVPATPQEGVVYMNVGDMFQRLSNGIYPSAMHRVVIAGNDGEQTTPARYSIPYFVSPIGEGIIEPQKSLIERNGKQVYESVTFNTYSEAMF